MSGRDGAARAGSGGLGDGLRLAVGTLSILPTPPPRTVDRRVAGWAMALAPLVGLLLAVVATVPLWLLGYGPTWLPGSPLATASPLLTAALLVGLLALLTRAMHLDGLADAADGLGSRKPAAAALDVMRRSDIGPFGVVTLVLALLLQVLALGTLLDSDTGGSALAVALVLSRAVLPLLCRRGVPAARADGLGSTVAGSVGPARLALAAALAALGVLAGCGLAGTASWAAWPATGATVGATSAALAVVALLSLGAGTGFGAQCVRRFGGVTGDVLGACVEVTFTAALVLFAVL